ncbi:MAG TPA: BatD family protein, partial [Gemmatimonadales bacterium]|nr:BatD family protein [Gemmatimonadales bacterium]
ATDLRRLAVKEVPPPSPAEFTGAVARTLSISRDFSPDTARVGESVRFTVTLKGEGNVALWPAPPVRWPGGVRVYPDQVNDQTGLVDGRLRGEKHFHYLVVSDSSGRLVVPALRYGFYNPGTRQYEVATSPAQVLPVQPNAEAALSRVSPPPLIPGSAVSPAWKLAHGLPLWVAILLLALPPILAVASVMLARRPHATLPVPGRVDALPAAEKQLLTALAPLVHDPDDLDGPELMRALRAAGVIESDVQEIVEVRERILQARFAGDGGLKRHTLIEQATKLSARLAGDGAASRRRPGLMARLPLLLLLIPLSGVGAQAPDPEELYQAGALRAAALRFADEAAAEPASPAHWYNLGATWFRLGDDASAVAAWRHGLRLAPRNRQLRQAIQLVPPPADGSGVWLSAFPVTPEELAVLAALCWIIGWIGIAVERHWRGRWLLVLAGGAVVGALAIAVQARQSQPIGVVLADANVTLSPHERAPVVAATRRGYAVRIERQESGWLLVEDLAGHTGWLPAARVARL